MQAFNDGELQVLVATSVVEVGIDVPNATLMTIEGGQRFGLAQLHQLRGRVSRGSHPGYVCVYASAKSEDALHRLQAFVRTNDGFQLAESDFQMRGPGDLFSLKQHGLPPFRIADLTRDGDILEEAASRRSTFARCDAKLGYRGLATGQTASVAALRKCNGFGGRWLIVQRHYLVIE